MEEAADHREGFWGHARVLIKITPSADSPRSGSVKLDDASLTLAPAKG